MAEAPATTPDEPRPTSVGTLWTGGALTWLEHLTLAAMRDAGLPVALFAYRDPGPLPEGVRLLQAAEIAAEDAAAPALLKDLFRWRLLAQAPGMIWCDLDMLLLRPPPAERGRLIVREPGERFASPAILALPPESPALSALLRFVEDPAPVPPWTAGEERAALEAARAAGEPVAAADQPWGVWGARALTWFLEESGEAEDALGPEAAFPLPRGEEGRLNARRADLSDLAHEGTFALPLRAAALRRDLIAGGTGLPRYWSFLGDRLRRHGVSPRAAPIPGAPEPPAHLWAERGAAQSPRSAAKTKAAPAGRVLIVTTMKNEGPFLLEWIAYHRSIGVTDFLVYTNDCDDGTDEFHDLLARKGIVVEHLDNPFRSMNGVKPQHAAYWNAQTRPVTAEADWVIPMDVDEFMNVHAGEGRFQDLLDAVPDANMISMTWRLFGNGFVGGFEDRFVLDQFEWCAHERTRKPHQAWGFKTAFRNIGLYRKFGVHRPKGLVSEREDEVRWVDGSGRPMPASYLDSGWRSSKRAGGYGLVTLNHYALRSSESYLVKRDRGRVNHVDRDQGLAYWFRMNHNAVRDRSIANKLPRAREEFARLTADPEIAAMQARCVAAHRAKIAALMERPDYRDLYKTIESKRMRNLSRMLDRFGNAIFDKGPEAVPPEHLEEADRRPDPLAAPDRAAS